MEVVVPVIAIAFIIQKVVEHIRGQFPIIDGPWVSFLALVLGVLAVWGTDVRVVADSVPSTSVAGWFDFIITAVALSAGSGFIADISGRSGERMSR